MGEKKFGVVVVFGESASKMYNENFDEDNPISESELEEFGCVVRRSFDSEAERDAYLMALGDSDGWGDFIIAEERFLKP